MRHMNVMLLGLILYSKQNNAQYTYNWLNDGLDIPVYKSWIRSIWFSNNIASVVPKQLSL